MDSLRRIEDDVRNLGIEAKKKYPAVKEATEKSFQSLKQMRDIYVAEVMRKDSKSIPKFRSSDITAPYYMVCSQADAPIKLLTMALAGIQLFLDLDAIPPNEAAQVMRIFNIQVSAGKPDIQLKILQMTLQFANLLSQDKASSQYLTESIVRDMLAIPLQLCDGKSSVSVTHTACATANQVIGLVMNGVCETLQYFTTSSHTGPIEINSDQASSSLALSAQLMVRDIAVLTTCQPGQWMKGITINQTNALDLLNDILSGWKHLFKFVPLFVNVLKGFVCPAINRLLKRLQTDYAFSLTIVSSTAGSAITSRVVRLARFLLHNFLQVELLDEIDLMIALMAQSYQASDVEDTITPLEEHPTNQFDKVLTRLNIPLSTAQLLRPQGILQNTLSNLSMQGNTGRTASTSSDISPLANILTFNNLSSGAMFTIHSHPVGTCYEAILSFLLMDNIVDHFMLFEGGCSTLSSIFNICLNNAAILLTDALSLELNVAEFEVFIKESIQVAIIENVLSGEEADSDRASKLLHEHLLSFGVVNANEVLLLSFQILQVTSRLVAQSALKVALQAQSRSNTTSENPSKLFLSPELLPPAISNTNHSYHPFLCRAVKEDALRSAMTTVCEHAYEATLQACVAILLSGMENAGAIRRSLGIIAEFAVSLGVLGIQRPCEVAVATLCKFAVPQWGRGSSKGAAMAMRSPISPTRTPQQQQQQQGSESQQPPHLHHLPPQSSNALRWRHVQAFVRLVQVVHVLADSITDWDVVMDCFEQLCSWIQAGNASKRVEVTPDELDKIVDCISRFKAYTMHIADDTLVKLMASLVALSLNSLAVSSNPNSSGGRRGQPVPKTNSTPSLSSSSLAAVMSQGVANSSKTNGNQAASYMIEGISRGMIGFSMQAAIEISKINAFRVASIWQMVMSHLRMVASLKSSTLRVISVAATHDVIASTMEFLLVQSSASSARLMVSDEEELHPYMMSTARLTDDILYNLVMPQFETTFDSLSYQRTKLNKRLQNVTDWPTLTQLDLFSSLKSLSSVRYDDVRKGVLFGLRSLLQGKGGAQIKGVGWVTIIELLILVPSSMRNTAEDPAADPNQGDDEDEVHEQWPRETLETAFSCMTLIVDDFLEELPDYAILQGICCLAAFGAQIHDVNISLTAVELLWKVTDHALSSTASSGESDLIKLDNEKTLSKVDLLNLTMTHLQTLSKDSRPEIRNCAMRTLFAAIVANSHLLSIDSWKFVFDDILFPLFGATVEKSEKASNEQSDAPELKKGVKMTLHHSRDTASKQWAETISLELKGFARILKACTRLLLEEDWFFATWSAAIDLFVNAARTPTLMPSPLDQSDRSNEEVSLAGLDSLMNLLKTASPASLQQVSKKGEASTDNAVMRSNKVKDMMWQSAWKAVGDLAAFDEYYFDEYVLKFLAMITDYYNTEASNETESVFHSAATSTITMRSLLDILVLLSRPRRRHRAVAKSAELQTMRSISSMLRLIIPSTIASYLNLVSAVSEIAFSITASVIKCPFRKVDIILEPVQASLRQDMGKYLLALIDFDASGTDDSDSNARVIQKFVSKFLQLHAQDDEFTSFDVMRLVCVDIVSRRFVIDACEGLLSSRSGDHAEFSAALSPTNSNIEPNRRHSMLGSKQGSSKFIGGFFSAVGNILLSPEGEDSHDKEWNGLELIGKQLHRFHVLARNDTSVENAEELQDEWGIFHTTSQEIELLFTVINSVLSPIDAYGEKNSFNMTPLVWSNLLISILSIGSPCTSLEIDRTGISTPISPEEVDKISKYMQLIIQGLTSYALQEKFPVAGETILIDVLAAISRLIIDKLGLLLDASHVQAQIKTLESCFQSLVAISQSWNLSNILRQRAMSAMLSILQDVVTCLFHGQAFATAEILRRCCESFLLQVMNLKCSLDALPEGDILKSGGVYSHMAGWSACYSQAVSSASERWTISLPPKTSSNKPSVAEFTVIANNHVLLLYPLAIKLLKSEAIDGIVDTALRQAASTILGTVDMSLLITSFKKIDQRLNKLEAEKQLREELNYLNV